MSLTNNLLLWVVINFQLAAANPAFAAIHMWVGTAVMVLAIVIQVFEIRK